MIASALAPVVRVARTTYRPWWAQTLMQRNRAPIRTIVAGRQSGKTHAAAEEVVKIMLERPGSVSCLLMPTYRSTIGTLKHVRRALAPLKNPKTGQPTWRWFAVEKFFKLANGSELYVRTADDKEGVPTRGLTVTGVLWKDEAAYIPRAANDAAAFTQAAVQDPLSLNTTTPAGRNWVFEEFQNGVAGATRLAVNESFRFRSFDSPFCTTEFLEALKKKVGARKAQQEIYAEFLGDADAAFSPDDIDPLFVAALPERKRFGERLTLGIDLGKQQDFVVITLMNEFGEAKVLARFRHVKGPDIEKRVLELAKKYEALCVLDEGAGGGYGAFMADYLERELTEKRVLRVKTALRGAKGELIEALISDVENRRLRALQDELGAILRHEMTFFEAHRLIVAGREIWTYHGPEGTKDDASEEQGAGVGGAGDPNEEDEGDHDDCVISLALANWGRIHGWEAEDPLKGDFKGFGSVAGQPGQPRVRVKIRKPSPRQEGDDGEGPRRGGGFGGVRIR